MDQDRPVAAQPARRSQIPGVADPTAAAAVVAQESCMTSRSLPPTLARAQDEIDDLLLGVQTGTIDRITLEAGLKQVQARLKALGVHQHHADRDADDPPGDGPKPK